MRSLVRRMGIAAAVVGLVFGALGSAKADILHPPNYSTGAFSSNTGSQQQEGSPFNSSASSTITAINWWGVYFAGLTASDSFTIRLFDFSGGVPAIDPFFNTTGQTRIDTGQTNGFGLEVFSYSVSLTNPVTVDADQLYLLSILDNTNNNWRWQLDGAGSHLFRNADGTSWTLAGNIPASLAFELIGTVQEAAPVQLIPEPSTLVAAVTGILLMAGYAVGCRRARRERCGPSR